MPVGSMDKKAAQDDHKDDDSNFKNNHVIGRLFALLYPDISDNRNNTNNNKGWDIEDKMRAADDRSAVPGLDSRPACLIANTLK